MDIPVTIVITPRDRYSSIIDCIQSIYEHSESGRFKLIVLDLGYPKGIMRSVRDMLAGKEHVEIMDFGRMIPMQAMAKVREFIQTPYAIFIDNDSLATANWIPPLLETAERTDAAVVYPLILEKAGVDKGAELRNHLFTTEIRVVDVDNQAYLIEHKTFRRALPDDLPKESTPTDAFELHCVMFKTQDLLDIEIPEMTIREHLDIGMQLKAKGRPLYVEPKSVALFDNLGSRANLADLEFFNRRWNAKITYRSSRLFEERWGYNFYSEQSIYNWAIRRRLFLLLRWLYIPIPLANIIDRVTFAIRRRLAPIWDPMPDAEERSESLYGRLNDKAPEQLSTQTS